MEKLGDKIFFLGRVIERTARGCSVEANLKYIRDVIVVLGLEDSRPLSTPNVKRTPTTESQIELETERRAVCRTQPWESCCKCATSVLREGNSKKDHVPH